jgi:hypothetical protein
MKCNLKILSHLHYTIISLYISCILWINVTITVLDIIHRSVFYSKHALDNFRTSQETHYFYTTSAAGLMRSIALWWCYVNITITIMGVIHRPVCYLKHYVSKTGLCLCLQIEPGPRDIVSLYFRTSTTAGFIKPNQIKPPVFYDLRFSQQKLWSMASSGMSRYVALVRTDGSVDRTASIVI